MNILDKISRIESKILNENVNEQIRFVLQEMRKIGIEKLPYSYSALKSFIDPKTMEIHYNKHYKGYVNKLNKLLGKNNNKTLDSILTNISKFNTDVRNNAGGAINHALFWKMLSPTKTNIPKELSDKIIKNYGSIDQFKKKFEESAMGNFGSGWVWLVYTPSGKLKIITTKDQDNPMMDTINGGIPLLGLDLWEHSYYLKYQNNREKYIKKFWNNVNWPYVYSLLPTMT